MCHSYLALKAAWISLTTHAHAKEDTKGKKETIVVNLNNHVVYSTITKPILFNPREI
jgi:hypothetical protein